MLPSVPAAAQEQIFFPGAEEYRHLATEFAARVYDADLILPLDDTAAVEMIRPAGLCFADERTLLVVDAATGTIHRADLRTRRFVARHGREGILPGEYKDPRAILKLESGYAVADSGNQRIQFLDEAMRPLDAVGRLGDRDDRDGFALPVSLAARGTRLYVCDRYNHAVKVIGLKSHVGRTPFGFDRFEPTKSLRHPEDADLHGDVCAVADFGHDRIAFYSVAAASPGRFLGALGAEPTALRRFAGPTGVAYDREGNLWVADRGNGRLVKLEAPVTAGTVAVEIRSLTAGVSLVAPRDVAVNAFGEVAFLDEALKRVVLLRADHFAKGRAAYRTRNFPEAMARFSLELEASRRAGAENVYALFYLAQCHDLEGRYREACDLYAALVSRFGWGAVRSQAEYRLKALRPLLPPEGR